MSDESEHDIQRKPDVEKMNNGAVRIVLDISDPIVDRGIRTEMVSVESNRSMITPELAEHLEWEFSFIDFEKYGIEVDDDW